MSERIKNFVVKAVNFGVALGLVGCQVESATNQQRNNPNQAPTPASSPAQDSINNQKSTNQAIKDFAATQTVVAETAKAPEGSNGGKKPAGTIFDADTLKDTTLTHEAVIAGNLLLNNALNWGKAVYEKNGDRVGYPTVTRLVTYSTDGSVKRSVDTSMVMLSDKDANLKGWMVVGMEVHTKDNGGKVVAGKVEINKPLTILKVKNGDVVKETGIGWMVLPA